MSHQIVLFRFRLSDGQSIGPAALQKLWSLACGSNDVKVSRAASGPGYGTESHTYSLCGSPKTANMPNIEAHLRRLLVEKALTATITLEYQR